METLCKKNKGIIALGLVFALLFSMIAGSLAFFSDKATESAQGTAGTVNIELNSMINLLDAKGNNIINPGDKREAGFEVVNLGNKSIDVKTEVVLSVESNFGHDLVLAGDASTQSQYDLYYADDVELVEGKGWMPKEGAVPVATKVIAEDGKSITYTLPIYSLNGNNDEHDEFETIDELLGYSKTENIVMLMDGQANNLWQNSTVSIAVKVYAKQHENTGAGWDLVGFDAEDSTESGIGALNIDTKTSYGTRVSNVELTVSKVVDSGKTASVEDGQFDTVEIGTYKTTKKDKISIPELETGTYVITVKSAPTGYTVEKDVVVVIPKDKTINKVLYVNADSSATLIYNTVDTDGNTLSNVDVKVSSTYEYGELKTDSNGAVILGDAKSGTNYTITAPDSVNNLPALSGTNATLTSSGDKNSETGIYGEEKQTGIYASKFGDTLYFASYPINEKDGVQADYVSTDMTYKNKYQYDGFTKTDITKVVFVDEIKPISTYYWFSSFSNLATVENPKNLNFSNVINADNMFYNCESLTELDLSSWDTSRLVTMRWMFLSCDKLTTIGDVSNWNLSSAVNMDSMFHYCLELTNLDVGNWGVCKVKNMSSLFSDCTKLTEIDVSDWDVSNATNMYGLFYNCQSLEEVDLTNWDVSNVTSMNAMFSNYSYFKMSLTSVGDLSGWNTSKVKNMQWMFRGCSKLTEIDVSNWDVSNVTTMESMFSGCSNVTELDVSNFDTSNVKNMSGMFSGCSKLTEIDVSGFDTSNVTDMGSMFFDCSKVEKLDVTGFDTSNVTKMNAMFGCNYSSGSKLKELDVTGFDTSKVTTMENMFGGCQSLTSIDVSSFDTSNVTNMSRMFCYDSALTQLDISNFNTAKVTKMESMFWDCNILRRIYVSDTWSVAKVTSHNNMFYDCENLVGGNGTTFNSSYTNKTYAIIDGTDGNPGYLCFKNPSDAIPEDKPEDTPEDTPEGGSSATTIDVSIYVVDTKGHIIPGATATITNKATGGTSEFSSKDSYYSDGIITANMLIGENDIVITKSGFTTVSETVTVSSTTKELTFVVDFDGTATGKFSIIGTKNAAIVFKNAETGEIVYEGTYNPTTGVCQVTLPYGEYIIESEGITEKVCLCVPIISGRLTG